MMTLPSGPGRRKALSTSVKLGATVLADERAQALAAAK